MNNKGLALLKTLLKLLTLKTLSYTELINYTLIEI